MSGNSILREQLKECGLEGRFAGHSPEFQIEEFEQGKWWVLDRAVKVGLVVRCGIDFAELLNHDPRAPRRDLSFPKYYHAPTQPGDRITMAKWVNAQRTTSRTNRLDFTVVPGGVTATLREEWANGRAASKQLTWKVDPDWGYVLAIEDEMLSPERESHEYCNFLPRGTTDDRPGFARYPYVLWQHLSGRIVRWNQNNVSARALGALDAHDRRRIATGGFLGYFGEPDHNPAIELLESVPGSTALTCPNMLDEHLSWVPVELGGGEPDGHGRYRSRSTYRLLSVPAGVADRLTARAELLDLVVDRLDPELDRKHDWCAREYPRRAGQAKDLRFCSIERGRVADFESKLDPAATFRGQIFPYADDADGPITVISNGGHSGTHSLRVRADGRPVVASPTGNCFHVTEGRRHRLSAWVKTDLRDGAAVLKAVEFLYSMASVTATHPCPAATGRSDWQWVSVEFTPGEKAHVVAILFEVNGHGTAWIDDLLLEELPA